MSLKRRHLMLGLLATSALGRAAFAAPRPFVDSAGRAVAVPERPTRVLAAGPPASILLYALAPDAMIGWVSQPGDDAKPFLLPQTPTCRQPRGSPCATRRPMPRPSRH